jgi:hypothetical protein
MMMSRRCPGSAREAARWSFTKCAAVTIDGTDLRLALDEGMSAKLPVASGCHL